MFRNMMSRFLLVVLLFSCFSCSSPKGEQIPQRTYFSIVDFAKDQWEINHGQPYGIKKTVYFNGTTDSLLTNAIALDWAPIMKVFFETDISKPKFIGEYDFSAFVEPVTSSKNFYYEAKNPKLYTRKLQVTADYQSDQVTSIYIEAEKKDRMGTKTLKLLYTPLQTISIQELETSKTGEKKEMRVVYEFL